MPDERAPLSRVEHEAVEGALAQAARYIATIRKHLEPIAGPAVLQSAEACLVNIAGALAVLDPSALEKDFDEVVKTIVERERRKNAIARLT